MLLTFKRIRWCSNICVHLSESKFFESIWLYSLTKFHVNLQFLDAIHFQSDFRISMMANMWPMSCHVSLKVWIRDCPLFDVNACRHACHSKGLQRLGITSLVTHEPRILPKPFDVQSIQISGMSAGVARSIWTSLYFESSSMVKQYCNFYVRRYYSIIFGCVPFYFLFLFLFSMQSFHVHLVKYGNQYKH